MLKRNDDSSSDSEAEKAKRKKCRPNSKKKFQDIWLSNEKYKGWLAKTADPYKCRCLACGKEFSAGTSEIDKHSQGMKHKKKVSAIRTTPSVSSTDPKKLEQEKHENMVKVAEIKICSYFAEHNVAFSAIDHFIDLLKEVIPDSKIIKDISLKRTKCTEIITNVIAKYETDQLVATLQKTEFSILIDESTDICDTKHMCLLARYINSAGAIETKLLELIEIDARDCTAVQLYGEFKKCLARYKIPLKNVIGVASDGANVMIGIRNSFFSHLKEENPNAILMRCICHTSAIVASKACNNLPRTVEDLIRSVYTYVSGSAKRCAELREMQEYFNNNEKQKLLKLSNTRWLCMHKCVERLLNNWDVLVQYFRVAVAEDGLKVAETILTALTNPIIKAYFYFLKYILHPFNEFNATFQSSHILIHRLHEMSKGFLNQMLQNFIKPEMFVRSSVDINIRSPHNLLEIEKVYVGQECENFLTKSNVSSKDRFDFKNNCLRFYQTAAEEMQKRFFDNEISMYLSFLDSRIALEQNSRIDIPNLEALGKRFLHFDIDLTMLEQEWRNLPMLDSTKKEEFKKLNLDMFWYEVSKLKNFADEIQFPNLVKLAKILLSLPHSNAEAERIFSTVTDVKTKKRNKIGHASLNAVCVIRSSFSGSKNCTSFKVTKEHLALHNYMMYSFKKKAKD